MVKLNNILNLSNELNIKLDRILNDLDFIKNRTATYLGNNEAITYLADKTPIFVNTNDMGCPINFINGGLYEEDYFSVLRSFRKPNLNMLDIGANLGVYSLRMAPYMRNCKIIAFEPIPKIRELFARSSFLNGYSNTIEIYPFAVSDKPGFSKLTVPSDHAGGASLTTSNIGGNTLSVEVKSLDNFLPENSSIGMIKLDVEGHELHALEGMTHTLQRSEQGIVIFEKLSLKGDSDSDIYDFFKSLDWSLYSINHRSLEHIDLNKFTNSSGYFVAARESLVLEDGLNRDFFHIYPTDLNIVNGEVINGVLVVKCTTIDNSPIFYGPYWSLPRGYYRLSIDGEIDEPVSLQICEEYGYKVIEKLIEPNTLAHEFAVYRDLTKFELVMRKLGDNPINVNLRKITLLRLG